MLRLFDCLLPELNDVTLVVITIHSIVLYQKVASAKHDECSGLTLPRTFTSKDNTSSSFDRLGYLLKLTGRVLISSVRMRVSMIATDLVESDIY